MAEASMLDELFTFVGFDASDAARLASAYPLLEPHFDDTVDAFYRAIESSASARAVFTGGADQIARQKSRLRHWLEGVFGGVYDAAYFELRARIGRVHVQIGLDQRLMFGAMSVVRENLHRALEAVEMDLVERSSIRTSMDKILDVELAIMLETYRERYVERQRAHERLATIGQLAASIGHELRNPLAVVETSVHLLRRRISDEKASRHLDRIAHQVDISGAIITDLLAMARDRPPERSRCDIGALIQDALSTVRAPETIEVDVRLAPTPLVANVDGSQLRQVLVNLLSNAAQAIVEGPSAHRRVEVQGTLDDAGTLVLQVSDSGPGFPEAVRGRLFEPLVTTRVHGIGLGLALCARIVDNHGGEIRAESPPEGGARIVITIAGVGGVE